MAVFEIILGGLLWRLRGIMGWPFTLLFALLCVFILYPVVGEWAWLYGLWIQAGEPTGWKPKIIRDSGEWKRASLLGFRIGGIGALAVPLSTWLHMKFGEPQIKILQNPKSFKVPFWSNERYLFQWYYAWNEVYYGVIHSLILLCITWVLYCCYV